MGAEIKGAKIQPQLYIAASGVSPEALAETLKAASAATVLLRQPSDGKLDAATARPLVEMAQKLDIAVLVEADASLARALRADGVHLPWGKDLAARYEEARDILGNRYIVGVDVGRSRHEAMHFAEAGADYIGFGIPPHVEDRETAQARRLELIGWWSEIFEVPCVAFDVETANAATDLAAAGADFVALGSDVMKPAEFTALASALTDAARDEALA